MPPFQVIQEPPKPDQIGGFMQGFSWSQNMVDQIHERRVRQQQVDLYRRRMEQSLSQDDWKFHQIQEETTRRRFADTKVAEVLGRAIKEKWDTDRTMQEMASVRDFAETKIGELYAQRWVEMNDPYRQAQIDSMNALAEYRREGGAYDRKRAQLDQDLADRLITQEQHQRAILGGRPPTEQTDMQSERIKQLVADGTLTPEEGELALKRLTKVEAPPSNRVDPYEGLNPSQRQQAIQIKAGLRPRATSAGQTAEKTLSYWLTQRAKTYDDLGDELTDPSSVMVRDRANDEIVKILTTPKEEATTGLQPEFKPSSYDPLAYEASPSDMASEQPMRSDPGNTIDQAITDAETDLRRKLKREPTREEVIAHAREIYRKRGGK